MKKLAIIIGLLFTASYGRAVTYTIPADSYGRPVMPYVTLYSTYTQSIVATDAAQYVELNSHSNGDGYFTQINKSTWSVVEGGVYEFCFSGIADITSLPAGKISMWGRINGVDVPDSNTIVSVVTAAVEQTLAMCWIGTLNAGDNFAAMTHGTDTDLQWLATPAQINPTRPAVPSIIMTVKKISALH